jgi:hypothetical protein
MLDINDIAAALNVVSFLIFGAVGFKDLRKAKLIAICWAIINVLYSYFFAWNHGYHNPAITINGIKFPLYGTFAVIGVLYLLFISSSPFKKVRLCLALISLVYLSTLRPMSFVGYISVGSGVERSIFLQFLTLAFSCCLLIPWSSLVEQEKSLWGEWFHLNSQQIHQNMAPIVMGIASYIVIYAINNIIVNRSIISLNIFTGYVALVRFIVLKAFFIVLINHIVSFGLSTRILRFIVPQNTPSFLFAFVSAGIYAGIHYNILPILLIREFLFGLILAYMYFKTGTLSYGFFVSSLIEIFTI